MEALKERMPGSALASGLRDKHSQLLFYSDLEKIQFIFSAFDQDKDGKLSKDELREFLITISPELRAQMDKLYHDAEEAFGGSFSTLPAMSYKALYEAYQEGGGDLQADFAAVWKRYHPTEEPAGLDHSIPAHYGPTGREEGDFEPAVDGDTQVNMLETSKGLPALQHEGADLEMDNKLGALSRKLLKACGRVLSPGIQATIKACQTTSLVRMLFSTLIAPPIRAALVEEASDNDNDNDNGDNDGCEEEDAQHTVTHLSMACIAQENEHNGQGSGTSTSCDAPQGNSPRQDCLNMEHVSRCQVVTRKSLTEGGDKTSGLPAPDSGKLQFMSHRDMSQGYETVVELAKAAQKVSMTRGVKMSYREVKSGWVTRDLMVELSSGGVPQANPGYDKPMTETPAVTPVVDPPAVEDASTAMVNSAQLDAHGCCECERALELTASVDNHRQDIMSAAVTDCSRTDLTGYQSTCGYTTCSTVVSMKTALSSPSVFTQITADQGFPTFYPMGPGSVAYSSSTLTSGPSVVAGVTRPQDVFTSEEKLNIIFDCFDQDADGVLNKGELRRFLKCIKPRDMDIGYGARLAGFLGEHYLEAAGSKDHLSVGLDKFKELYKESNKDVDIDFLIAMGRYPERMTRYAAAACAKRINRQLHQEDAGLPEGHPPHSSVDPNEADSGCLTEVPSLVEPTRDTVQSLAKLAADEALESPKEADEALESPKEVDEALESPKEADEALESPKEADEALESPKEADEALESPKEADEALESPKEADEALESPKESRWEADNLTNEMCEAGQLMKEKCPGTRDVGISYGRVTELERSIHLLDGKVEKLRGKMERNLGQRSLHTSEGHRATELTLVREHAPAVQEKVNEVAPEQGHRGSSGGESSQKDHRGGEIQPQQSTVKEAHAEGKGQVLSLPIDEGTERRQTAIKEKRSGRGDPHQKEKRETPGGKAARKEREGPERHGGGERGTKEAVDEDSGRGRKAPFPRSIESKEGRKPRCDGAKGGQRQSKIKHQSEQSTNPGSPAFNLTVDCEAKAGTRKPIVDSPGTTGSLRGTQAMPTDLLTKVQPREARRHVGGEPSPKGQTFKPTAVVANDVPSAPESPNGYRRGRQTAPPPLRSPQGYGPEVYPSVAALGPTSPATRASPAPRPSPSPSPAPRATPGRTAEPPVPCTSNGYRLPTALQPYAEPANDNGVRINWVPPCPQSANGYRPGQIDAIIHNRKRPESYEPAPPPLILGPSEVFAIHPVPSTSNDARLPTPLQPYAEPVNDNGVQINWVPPCPQSANGYRVEQVDAIIHNVKR